MFAWETLGKKTFKGSLPDELFKPTKKLAANQGLYNGFLSAGLIWSFLIENPEWKTNVQIFFLGCVIAAGIYGAVSASKKDIFRTGFARNFSFSSCFITIKKLKKNFLSFCLSVDVKFHETSLIFSINISYF
jgi:uncharacterized membrane protein